MAEYDAGTVKATLKADGAGLHAGVETAKKDFTGLKKSAEEAKNEFKSLGITAGASLAALTAGVFKAVQANNQLKASMMGLDSIAKGTVGTYSKVQAELEKIRKDGMIPLTNAIAAYKNLLARYQDEEEAIKVFNRLADAAAFGRQGHLSLGEAIQSASEGLKNENSVLVDNAGVTKNVSDMWEEYAASIGKTVSQLTDAEKRQAEINSIIEVTRHQVGDLAKLQNSLSGQLSAVNAISIETATAWGEALEPAASDVAKAVGTVLSGLKEFIQANPSFVAGITAGTMALSAMIPVAVNATTIVKGLATAWTFLTGPAGIALIALSAITGVIVMQTTAAAKAREETKRLADTYRDETNKLDKLIDEYEELTKKTNLTANEKERLKDVSSEIAKMVPDAVQAYDRERGAIIDLTKAVDGLVASKTKELDIRKKSISSEREDEWKNQQRILKQMAEATRFYNSAIRQIDELVETGMIKPDDAKKRKENFKKRYDEEMALLTEQMNTSKKVLAELEIQEYELNQRLNGGITRDSIKQDQVKPLDSSTSTKTGDEDKRTAYQKALAAYEANAVNWTLEKQVSEFEKLGSLANSKEKDAYQKRLAQLRKELTDEIKKTADALTLERAKGYEKELLQLELAMEEELKTVEKGSEREANIREKYQLQRQKIQDKYAAESKAQQLELSATLAEIEQDFEQAEIDRENARYEREMSNIELTATEKERLKLEHEQNLLAIQKKYADQRLQIQIEENSRSKQLELDQKIAALEYQKAWAELEADSIEDKKELLKLERQIIDLKIEKIDAQIEELENEKELIKTQTNKSKELIQHELAENEEKINQLLLERQRLYDDLTLKEQRFISETDKMNKAIKEGFSDFVLSLTKSTNAAEEIWQKSMDNLLKSFTDFLFEAAMKSKLFGPIIQSMGNVFGWGTYTPATATAGAEGAIQKFHTGGLVEPIRAHSGWLVQKLQPDEVPIIAQTGERVLSRAETAEYERNKGKQEVQVNVINQAGIPLQGDAEVTFDGPRMVVNWYAQAMERNIGGIRKWGNK